MESSHGAWLLELLVFMGSRLCGWPWAEPTPEAATSVILFGFCFLLGVVCELLRALKAVPRAGVALTLQPLSPTTTALQPRPPHAPLPDELLAPSATEFTVCTVAHHDSGLLVVATCPLAAEFPAVHPVERRRFIVARDGDATLAAELLRKHLAWRAENLSLPRPDGTQILSIGHAGLPEFVWVHPGRARDGTRIVSHGPCFIDLTLGCSDDYVVALAGFIDGLLDRGSADKMTVLIDCRPILGAPNVPVTKLLPLIQQMSKTLSEQFPERLENLVVYPVPMALSFIWGLVCPFLAPKTADKIRLLCGPAREGSPCPVKLGEIVSLEALREADRPRHAALEQHWKPTRSRM